MRRAVEGLRSRNRWHRAASAVQLGRMRSDAAGRGARGPHERRERRRAHGGGAQPGRHRRPAGGRGAHPGTRGPVAVDGDHGRRGPRRDGPAGRADARRDRGRGRLRPPGAHEAAVTAVRVLGEIRDPRAEPVLIELLEGAERPERACAGGGGSRRRRRPAGAAGACGTPSRDEAWQVRAQAASSLGALGDRDERPRAQRRDRGHGLVGATQLRRGARRARRARPRGAGRALATSPDRYVRDRCIAVLEDLARRGRATVRGGAARELMARGRQQPSSSATSSPSTSSTPRSSRSRSTSRACTCAAWRSAATTSSCSRRSRRPISIILPAFNEEACIVDSVDALRLLEYGELEIVVVDDGSTDGMLARLTEAYDLVRSRTPLRLQLPCRPIARGLRLPAPARTCRGRLQGERRLQGGRHQRRRQRGALPARLRHRRRRRSSRRTRCCARSARSSSVRARPIAVGGTVRIVNGCAVSVGRITRLGAPRNLLAALQVVEYMRAFIASRTAWSTLGGLFLISGAFGVFRKDALVEVGGFNPEAIGEDMELVLRMHRTFRAQKRRFRIVFVPDPVVWTEAPESPQGAAQPAQALAPRSAPVPLVEPEHGLPAVAGRRGHARPALSLDLRGRRHRGRGRRLRGDRRQRAARAS